LAHLLCIDAVEADADHARREPDVCGVAINHTDDNATHDRHTSRERARTTGAERARCKQ
jgi:hypothetical protein